jgi:hypothetical protein
MQAADFGKLHDPPRRGELDRPEVGCVLVEREMGTCLVVVGEIAGQDAAQVPFAKDEYVIQTFAPDRADQALHERVLPGALGGGEDFLDIHALHAAPKVLAVDLVAVAKEIARCGVVRERVDDLLSGPVGGGVLGHVEVDDPSAMVSEHDKNEEHAQACGGDGEEVEGDEVSHMVVKERPPGLRRPRAPLRHEPGDGALGNVNAELEELSVDTRGAPQGIRRGHFPDEGRDLDIDRRAASGRLTREPRPVLAKPAALPAQDSVGRDDDQRLPPPGPDSGQAGPEQAVSRVELRAWHRSLVDGQLLAQGEVLEGELAVAAEEEGEEPEEVDQESDHEPRLWPGRAGESITCRADDVLAKDRLNNKIRVLQRRAYGLRDEEYLRLKILTCMLPAI